MKFSPLKNMKDRLMGRGAGLTDLPLCAYGKLELYKDYINLGVDDGPAAEFKAWLDQGFGMTFEEFGGRSVTIEHPWRVLMAMPGSKNYAVATVWPSADEGKLRRFPFSFFCIVPRSSLVDQPVHALWPTLESIWTALEAHYESALPLLNVGDFYHQFQKVILTTTEADPEETPEPSPVPAEWLSRLETTGDAEFPARIGAALSELIAACREFPEEGLGLAVSVPLASGYAMGDQASIWTRAFAENLKKCSVWPTFIFPAQGPDNSGRMSLIWREVRSDDSRLLGADIGDYDYIEDIAADAKGAGATGPDASQDLGAWIAALG